MHTAETQTEGDVGLCREPRRAVPQQMPLHHTRDAHIRPRYGPRSPGAELAFQQGGGSTPKFCASVAQSARRNLFRGWGSGWKPASWTDSFVCPPADTRQRNSNTDRGRHRDRRVACPSKAMFPLSPFVLSFPIIRSKADFCRLRDTNQSTIPARISLRGFPAEDRGGSVGRCRNESRSGGSRFNP